MKIWIERLFLLIGLAGVGIWLGSTMTNAVWQSWENWVFDQEVRGEPISLGAYFSDKEKAVVNLIETWHAAKPARGPESRQAKVTGPEVVPAAPIPNDHLLGRLSVSRLHLSATVREGVGETTLSRALGHIPGTSIPGQRGNVGVAGHRDTLFRALKGIQKNDLIEFETVHGSYTYQVDSTQIVKPTDVSVLKAKQYPELTLVTCYPFYYVGSAPDRFIVKARQVSLSPAEKKLAAADENLNGGKTSPLPDEAKGREAGPRFEETSYRKPAERRIRFTVARNHSAELAPGISLGVTETDVPEQRINGWMWLMGERRTIWLRNQDSSEPVVFYGPQDGKRHELKITQVGVNSVSGYLVEGQ